ncbi:MAG TPA: DciA family protein [Tepidisphaeraceae bacterium]|nr:DciA family protein [Tepidisphaeraceae bacterium]
MSSFPARRLESDLKRLSRIKKFVPPQAVALGPEMIQFFQRSVQKRQTKLSKIGEAFGRLVPETLTDHCAIESLHRGTLTVLVDSASHLYELKQLLLAGVQQQLMLACKSAGLKKVSLKPGRWYEENAEHVRKIRFTE